MYVFRSGENDDRLVENDEGFVEGRGRGLEVCRGRHCGHAKHGAVLTESFVRCGVTIDEQYLFACLQRLGHGLGDGLSTEGRGATHDE